MPPGSLLLTVRADPGVGGCEESSTGTLRQEARRRRWPESCADPARQGQSDLTVQDARPHGHVESAPLSVVGELHLCRPTRCRPTRCPMTWTRRWPPPDSRNSRRGGPPFVSRTWCGREVHVRLVFDWSLTAMSVQVATPCLERVVTVGCEGSVRARAVPRGPGGSCGGVAGADRRAGCPDRGAGAAAGRLFAELLQTALAAKEEAAGG